MEIIEQASICLSEIDGLHDSIADVASALSECSFASTAKGFSETSVADILKLHPIFVVRRKRQLFVVAGFRTFQIANINLQSTSKINCSVVQATDEEIIRFAKTDILASSVVFSLSTKVAAQTKKLVNAVSSESAESIHKDFASTRGLTRVHLRNKT